MYAILDNFLIHTLVFTSTGITVNIPVATLSDLSIKDPKYAAISLSLVVYQACFCYA